MALRLLIGLGIAGALVACDAPLRPLPTTMCHEVRSGLATAGAEDGTGGDGSAEPPREADEPSDAEWIALLTDDEEGRPSSCERALALTPPQEPRCDGSPPRTPARLFAIPPRIAARMHREGEDDVVWVATHRTAEGMHAGPIALVRRTTLGLEVQAIGRHVGPAEHVEARVLRAGGAVVVSMESESAGDRVADLLVRSGGALVPAALEDPELGCQAPARVVLRRRREERATDGWVSRSVRTAMLDETPDAIVVREHLSIRELDAADLDAPPRATHDADAVRRLVASGTRLRADRGPLAAPARDRTHATPPVSVR